jgi:hypothetical protein
LAAEISGHTDRGYGSASGVVIRNGQVGLGLGCGGIAQVQRPGHSGRSRHDSARTYPKIAKDYGATGAGDLGTTQYTKRGGQSKRHWRLGCRQIVAQEHQGNGEEKSSSYLFRSVYHKRW